MTLEKNTNEEVVHGRFYSLFSKPSTFRLTGFEVHLQNNDGSKRTYRAKAEIDREYLKIAKIPAILVEIDGWRQISQTCEAPPC